MTASNFPDCLSEILLCEGGYVNHPKDPGGPTNLGITQVTLSQWPGGPASVDDVKALTPATVGPIYRAGYWNPLLCDQLPYGVDLMCFDGAVNMGVGTSARMLQTACGAQADGHIGPVTLALVMAMPAPALIDAIADLREARYRKLSTFLTFGKGWLSRLATVRAKSLEMTQ